MTKLSISNSLSLPLDAVTETFAVMGIRGSGKTHTASVMAEEMLKAGQPIIVYDPTGAWYGLKTSADGKHAGFPVVIFGGEHPDVPLEETAGETIAKVIVEKRFPAILDVSLMRKGARIRFMQAFCETLYHRNREALHFFVDEAHTIAPQRSMPETARVLGAMEDIVLQGRRRGIGLTVISQRPALVNTNLRTQCSTLVAMRIVGPHDRKAIEDWTEAHGTPERAKEMMTTLAVLGKGEGWVWSVWLDLFKRITFRQRETFDSSATPEVGKKLSVPKVVAEIDLEKLGEQIQATVQKAKAEDPRELRKEIAELRRQLSHLSHRHGAGEDRIIEKIKEVHVLKNGQLDKALLLQDRLQAIVTPLVEAIAKATSTKPPPTPLQPSPIRQPPPMKPMPVRQPRPAVPVGDLKSSEIGAGGKRRMLVALAQRPQGMSARQLGVRSGLSSGSGTFGTYLGELRSQAWIVGDRSHFQITEAGVEALGNYEPLPTGQALLSYWLRELGEGGLARMLRALADVYPNALTKESLALAAGMSAGSGTFGTYLGKLRSLELCDGRTEITAAAELFD